MGDIRLQKHFNQVDWCRESGYGRNRKIGSGDVPHQNAKGSSNSYIEQRVREKTSGLIIAGPKDNSTSLGDEPFQFYKRYPETIVAVSEKRTVGMKALEKMADSPNFVVLDDVMQHRWVCPQMMIMTSSFQRPYFKDFIFPCRGFKRIQIGGQTG